MVGQGPRYLPYTSHRTAMGCNRLDAAGVHHFRAVDGRLAGEMLLGCVGNEARSFASIHVGRDVEKAPNFDDMVRAARGHRVDDRAIVGGWSVGWD